MYEDNAKRINWVKVALEMLFCLLVVILSVRLIKVINSKKNINDVNKAYDGILTQMNDYAVSYFKDNLPSKSGNSSIIYLKDLVDENKVIASDKCNFEQSYIKATRLDSEYQIKSYLICDDYENSINSFEESSPIITIKPSSTTVKVKTTTKKVTTTKKKNRKYTVSFNSNGGTLVKDIEVNENDNIKKYEIPVREGYKFLGWYYHGNQFNFNTKINHDYVLTARWIKE